MSSTKTPNSPTLSTSVSQTQKVDWSPYASIFSRVQQQALCLIDLRSPGEFALGAMPGAVNVPLFTNIERHEVGLAYKQSGPEEATSLGLEIFARKAADFLDQVERLAAARPVTVHCWRGGMRSQSVAMYLRSVGHKVELLEGGYKVYRRYVGQVLDQFALHPIVVLNGRTGAGKTDFLREVASIVPTVDFEGIAKHRGSAFGDLAQDAPSPSQQNFENLLAQAYLAVADHPRLLVEIENFIGPCCLPFRLRQSIQAAPMVLLERDFDDRVARTAAEYTRGWTNETRDKSLTKLVLLEKSMNKADIQAIRDAIVAGDLEGAIRDLLSKRYDPTYDKGILRCQGQFIAKWNLTNDIALARQGIERIVGKLIAGAT